MSQPKTPEKAIRAASEAFAKMQELDIPPLPVNYAVWYTHATGENPTLSKAISKMKFGDPKTAAMLTLQLYEKHLSPEAEGQLVRDTGAKMEFELTEVLSAITTAMGNAEDFETALQSNLSDLAADQGLDAITSVVKSLASEAEKIQVSNSDLQKRLEESTTEIMSLRQNLADVRKEALTDALTEIANRKMLDITLAQAISKAEDDGSSLVIVMTDIDFFKKINDTYGHQTGDQVLRLVAKILDSSVREEELAARYGGEEFSLVLPGSTLEQAKEVCERVRNTVSSRQIRNRSTGESMGNITLSLGVAKYRPGDTADEMVERADACLYYAKRHGRNQTVLETQVEGEALAS